MQKVHKMLVLNDARRTVTYKKIKGRRTLKFVKECFKNEWEGGQCTVESLLSLGFLATIRKARLPIWLKRKMIPKTLRTCTTLTSRGDA